MQESLDWMPYPTPDAAEACALLDRLRLVYKGDALAQVELSLLLAVHAINLDQGGVVVLIRLSPAMCRKHWQNHRYDRERQRMYA